MNEITLILGASVTVAAICAVSIYIIESRRNKRITPKVKPSVSKPSPSRRKSFSWKNCTQETLVAYMEEKLLESKDGKLPLYKLNVSSKEQRSLLFKAAFERPDKFVISKNTNYCGFNIRLKK